MPPDRSALTVAVLCGALVLAAVIMIAVGLPEQTVLQSRLLQLYSVPVSGALALGVVHLAARLPQIGRRTRAVLVGAGVAAAVGVALMTAGLLAGLDALLPLGQALSWLGLGFALLWVVGQRPKRDEDVRTFGLAPIAEDEEREEEVR